MFTLRKLLAGLFGLRQPCTPGGSSSLQPIVKSSSLSQVSCLDKKTWTQKIIHLCMTTKYHLNILYFAAANQWLHISIHCDNVKKNVNILVRKKYFFHHELKYSSKGWLWNCCKGIKLSKIGLFMTVSRCFKPSVFPTFRIGRCDTDPLVCQDRCRVGLFLGGRGYHTASSDVSSLRIHSESTDPSSSNNHPLPLWMLHTKPHFQCEHNQGCGIPHIS